MMYYALLGDLNASRRLDRRAEVQRGLRKAIATLNERDEIAEVAPLRLTAGDEVQGIGTTATWIMDVMIDLSEAVAPADFTWGLGYGTLDTDIDEDIALMDGPCFHEARKALEQAKRERRWFAARGLETSAADTLAALMNLMGAIREGWTGNQARYVRHARRSDTQAEVARALGKADSSVSRALHAAKYDRVLEGERAARTLLESLPS